MITVKDLNDIAENKIKNEAQKEIIRTSFPPHIADRMCAAIDGQEKMEHFIRFLNEYNEWMVMQQKLWFMVNGQFLWKDINHITPLGVFGGRLEVLWF